MERMMKAGSVKGSEILATSGFFKNENMVTTELPILNVAYSGKLDGGFVPGLTILAGASKTFKTMLGLYSMKSYLEKYKDSIAILYDSEFGITPEYLVSMGIDATRVLHVPIMDIEELKFDIVGRLQDVTDKDKLFILIDSVGNLASKKEREDAENEKSVSDMSRAKALKSLFRIITPTLTKKRIPCFAIQHIYMSMDLFPKAIVSGGSGSVYSANQIFIITKAQEKNTDGIVGWNFTINIEKSRFVKEKAKLIFTVLYGSGIKKWSAMFDLALESGHIQKASTQGWYNTIDLRTGEVIEPKRRAKDIDEDDEFFEELVKNAEFKEFVSNKYMLSGAPSDEIEDET